MKLTPSERKAKRRSKIRNAFSGNQQPTVKDLLQLTGASRSTINADLRDLKLSAAATVVADDSTSIAAPLVLDQSISSSAPAVYDQSTPSAASSGERPHGNGYLPVEVAQVSEVYVEALDRCGVLDFRSDPWNGLKYQFDHLEFRAPPTEACVPTGQRWLETGSTHLGTARLSPDGPRYPVSVVYNDPYDGWCALPVDSASLHVFAYQVFDPPGYFQDPNHAIHRTGLLLAESLAQAAECVLWVDTTVSLSEGTSDFDAYHRDAARYWLTMATLPPSMDDAGWDDWDFTWHWDDEQVAFSVSTLTLFDDRVLKSNPYGVFRLGVPPDEQKLQRWLNRGQLGGEPSRTS